MIIERNKLYRVEGHELDDEVGDILIEHMQFLIHAPNIEKACQMARTYFGMGLGKEYGSP